MKKIIYAIPIFLGLMNCYQPPQKNSKIEISKEYYIKDIKYGNHPNQNFDILLPSNRETSHRTFILIHGGAWEGGEKQYMEGVGSIIHQNFPDDAIMNLQYRFATDTEPAFPMQLNDIEMAIQKMENSHYEISKKYAFIGVSAGAHLSLLYSYTRNSDKKIKMVCSIVGPTNFLDEKYYGNKEIQKTIKKATGYTYKENPTFLKKQSPLYNVTSNSIPTLLLYGKNDPLIPVSQGSDLYTQLQKNNIKSEFYLYEGGHFDWNKKNMEDASSRLVNFVKNNFK